VNPFLLVVLSYLLGATPTSYWVGRAFYGVDLRARGSGNLGATNTFRVLGPVAAVPVVLVDVAKGFVPAFWFPSIDAPSATWGWALAYGTAAIVGHVFSVWVRFRGGKGVATSAGVFLGLAPAAVLVGFVVWSVTVATTRLVSLGSILAALSLPVSVAFLRHPGGAAFLWFTVALAAFVVWAHRSNIRRLARGEELRLGSGAARAEAGEPDPEPEA
jgi:glycerol-3-phosphate acyltransferase PlsY